MTKDELYPVIDEVLHERWHPNTNAGSAWIERDYDDAQLRIHDLAEALCDAIVERMAGGPVASGDRDIVGRLEAEVVRCPGRGSDGHGMQHCAECCFGSGVQATTDADLRIMLLARDAKAEIERLRRWQEEAAIALNAATVIGQRHGTPLHWANHDRLTQEARRER